MLHYQICKTLVVYRVYCMSLYHSQFCNYLEEEERAGCFACFVLWMPCYYKRSLALPHGALGWSALCDCVFS